MDLKQIKQIIELMKRAELSEFAVEEEGFKLKIRRGANGITVTPTKGSNPPFLVAADAPAQSAATTSAEQASTLVRPAADAEEAGMAFIKSPMVGTFYRSPSPDSQVFVESGSKVTESSVVCIVEAMKIMNEIQAEIKGTIVEVLIENGEPVEYGQKLFKIKNG